MSANDHEQHQRRGWGMNPIGMILCAAILYLGSAGPFAGLWQNGTIPDNVGRRMAQTVYAPITWVDEETEFFKQNRLGKAYADYAGWWIDAMK